MTVINYDIHENPHKYFISCVGHAGYDEIGRDIVCSAISCLVQTLAFCNTPDKCEIDAGRVVISGEGYEDTIRAKMAVDGLKMVAEAYPNNIQISALGKEK